MSSSPYLRLRDILSEEERVPVTWEIPARGVGHLDPSVGAGDIAEGAEMELPLWLATALGPRPGKNFVSVRLSRTFGTKLRESLRADAMSVRLRDRSPHFYEVGLRMSDLVTTDETSRLPSDIQATLAQRVEHILDQAPRGLGKDTSAYQGGLTELEAQLFLDVQNHAALRQRQRQGLGEVLLPASESTASKVRAQARLPQSRGQKRERSLMQNV